MYILLSIVVVFIVVPWFILSRSTAVWIRRPIDFGESMIAGFSAWIFIMALTMWFIGIILTLIDFLDTHSIEDLWTLILSGSLTIFAVDFISRSREDLDIDDTMDFIKEAIQFRRSAQHRLGVLELLQQRRTRKKSSRQALSPGAVEHAKLQIQLTQDREVSERMAQLQANKSIELTDAWKSSSAKYATHPIYECIEEITVDPVRKRASFLLNLVEYDAETFEEDVAMLKLFRQIYDFLQCVDNDPRLKQYGQYFESYYLLCRRAKHVSNGSGTILYPFFKVGITAPELKKLEGAYFNPRKLTTIAAVAFNKGAQV